ncbi:MgtC/SapB family protein [Corynebacterium choanae]|uniref:Putative Mg(2+) transport ATPase n=1 Tax=Corynebacterium choanae TaxID=1862358 RepID=A0A3G6JA63_9CORY|nr:MgtC/SapB family protein [Corynebacterium choanae]AZA14702.1 putative Mg(2+) transport ATPase [Corynebacterium choanae]
MNTLQTLFNFSHFSTELTCVGSAFVLCLLLGVERHMHLKDAGIKTHVLVGVGACVFTLVSAYGFNPDPSSIARFDPSRIAAQVVSGIGFLGAGVIFVNNDTVRGLTTAATVWVAAAVGMACGASMVPLAAVVTIMHYLLVFAVGPIMHRLPQRNGTNNLHIDYEVGRAIMPQILTLATNRGFTVSIANARASHDDEEPRVMHTDLELKGKQPIHLLTEAVASLEGVRDVRLADQPSDDL